MPKRKHKKYSRPRKIFDVTLLKEETGLINKYGLRSRREVWRASYAISKIRDIAKKLITADEKDKAEFIERQKNKGFKIETIADILGLSKEDYLKRRLQSIVVTKKIAKTYKQARQLITHKHISIGGHYIDSPSHLTTLEEESTLEANVSIPKEKVISDEEKEILKQMNKNSTEEKE